MNIYQEEILEHYHDPCCQKEIEKPTHKYCSSNSSCGDKICMNFVIKNNIVKKVHFSGEGCAISQASASMLSEKINGQSIKVIEKLTKKDIIEMLGIKLSPSRLKCALLSLETLHKALKS